MSCARKAMCDFCDARCPDYIFDFKTIYDEEYCQNVIDWDSLEEDFISWYDAGKPMNNLEEIDGRCLSELFITELFFGDEVDTIRGDDRRWSVWIDYIFKIKSRYFKMGRDKPLTEYGDNEWMADEDIVEVEKKVVVRVVNDWVEKK